MLKKTRKKEKLRLKRKRTIMSLVLMLALVLSGITQVNAEAKPGTLESGEVSHEIRKYYDDTEDTSSYTPIRTIADLAGINNNPSGNYILMNDIDMTEETREGGSWNTGNVWTPLDEFSGIFDGNGYRIIGMNIYGKFDSGYIGLFSKVSGCIKSLGMIDVNIDNVTIYYDSDNYFLDIGIGAITGYLRGKIQNCYVTGNISAGDYSRYTGGLVGEIHYGNYVEIDNSYNTAKVSGSGIAGICDDGNINHCYNIGELNSYPISGCWQPDYDYEDYTYEDYEHGRSNYALQVKSLESKYTKMLTESQMRTQNMYVGFDFENTRVKKLICLVVQQILFMRAVTARQLSLQMTCLMSTIRCSLENRIFL